MSKQKQKASVKELLPGEDFDVRSWTKSVTFWIISEALLWVSGAHNISYANWNIISSRQYKWRLLVTIRHVVWHLFKYYVPKLSVTSTQNSYWDLKYYNQPTVMRVSEVKELRPFRTHFQSCLNHKRKVIISKKVTQSTK